MNRNGNGFGERLQQGWREFRSMRTALVLLFFVASGAIFGSLFPQRNISPQRVTQYFSDHPKIAPLLDRFGLFDVFGSPWFMAIYLALLIALVACLIPRVRTFLRIVRARPPAPRPRLDHYRNAAAFTAPVSPEQAVAATRRVLRRRRFRVVAHGPGELAAEKGYLRESGSLVFHVSFLLLLIGLAYGKGFGYRGQITLIEGQTLANTRIAYDTFTPGRFFGPSRLAPFSLRLDRFANTFYDNGTPKEYASWVTASTLDGRRIGGQKITVNHPMTVDGVRVFQSDYGYAPVVTVRDKSGHILAADPVLSERAPVSEVSTGAIKLPSLNPQVGLALTFFTGLEVQGGQFFNDPRLVDPVLVVLPYQGDLHANQAQSIFTLDTTKLQLVGSQPLVLSLGKSGKLANGLQVSFSGLRRYTVLTLARDPGVPVMATAGTLILIGLIPSLYVTRRRVWLRAVSDPAAAGESGGARVELAGLALQGKLAFVEEFREIAAEVQRELLSSGSGSSPESPSEQAGSTLSGSPAVRR